ncbi:MAG: hypothetical protein QOE61_1925 [Micromonosporaceae bacterium]|nr:hypothetical protein [Micromonosporaceae bacterium]
MPTIAQVILGLLLLAAGLTGVVAAVLGNPIHVGGMAIPGPKGGRARTAVAGISSAALAASAIVFILAGAQGTPTASSGFSPPQPTMDPAKVQGRTGSNSGSVGGLPSLMPTGSPKPPAAPSTAPPMPGKPTVTSITVTPGTLSGCDRTYHAAVTVANGPVTITYVISVDGYAVGPNPRTATVSGSTAGLDDFVVDGAHPGEIVYNLLSPSRLSDLKTWTVPTACQPNLSVDRPYISKDPGPSRPCANAVVDFEAKLHIIAPPKGVNVTYHAVVNGVPKKERVGFFQGTMPIGDSETLPDASSGNITVQFFVTAPVEASSDQAVLQATCTSPAPTTEPPSAAPDPGPASTSPQVAAASGGRQAWH